MSERVVFPRLDQDMEDGIIATWLVAVGDTVSAGDELAEMETAKVTATIESPADGIVLALLYQAGDVVAVGEPIAVIGEAGEEVAAETAGDGEAAPNAAQSEVKREIEQALGQPVPALNMEERVLTLPLDRSSWKRPHQTTPRARYEARSRGMPWQEILEGRVEEKAPPEPQPERPERGRRVALTGIRRATVRTVEASWRIPQFSVEVEVATESLKVMLGQIREAAPSADVTLTDMLIAAMAEATRSVPEVNAWFEGAAIRYFDEVDLSLMVQTERGLFVPVLPGVHGASLRAIAVQRQQLVEAAHNGELREEQLQPGTIALSNLGMFAIHRFNAILYPPQVAILAVGRARNDRSGDPMWLTLTVDHRAVDGATAARYLEALQELLAKPLSIIV